MSAPVEFPRITKAELLSRLADATPLRATVVTPNRRLALALKSEFDKARMVVGTPVWDAVDVLPLSTFVERAYEDALYSERGTELPACLAPAQEQALWERIIRESDSGRLLLAIPETAALVREAWQLAHAWRLGKPVVGRLLNEDGRAFQQWAQHYESSTRRVRQTDGARLPDVMARLLAWPEIRKPATLVHYGFDLILPQQVAFLEATARAGCKVMGAGPEPRRGTCTRVACADSLDEMRHAARWARARLESNCKARIGVIVPELAKNRPAIQRLFSAIMEPAFALPGGRPSVFPFNVSFGAPLSSYPLVNAAFLTLELAGRGMDFGHASRLIRSPFIAGAGVEFAPRSRLDARLRERAEASITLDRLLVLIGREDAGCQIFAKRLSAFADFRKARLFGRQLPSAWARAISDALALVGFPGDRGLDSAEFQTLAKWHEVITEFAALDRVVPRIGYPEAVARLRRMAADTLFQPETPAVPIQILGALEATGMDFDHLWVMGLSDEIWPPVPHPNPFLPVEWQRAAGIPQGSAAASLALARRLITSWRSCAGEVILSHPQREADRELEPSPLISEVPEQSLVLPAYQSYRDAVHGARRMESREDATAPPVAEGVHVIGGTAVIRDYSACPFRAFALHRVGAQSLVSPHTGLDAMERGILVHSVLAQMWARVKSREALDALPEADLDALLAALAEDAVTRIRRDRPTVLSGRFVAIEKRRLVRLARAWLEVDRMRGGFTVLATEDSRRIEVGGLRLNARLDRVDQTDDGRRVVIDYKTGKASPGSMLGERPDEPQLPLYVIGAEPEAAAVAFAQIRAGDMRYAALARDDDLLPGVKAFSDSRHRRQNASWRDLVDAWRTDLTRLAAAFVAGDARVDPKQYPATCSYCDVRPFCRIYERLEGVPEEDTA
jgi:probable DNA repair protein